MSDTHRHKLQIIRQACRFMEEISQISPPLMRLHDESESALVVTETEEVEDDEKVAASVDSVDNNNNVKDYKPQDFKITVSNDIFKRQVLITTDDNCGDDWAASATAQEALAQKPLKKTMSPCPGRGRGAVKSANQTSPSNKATPSNKSADINNNQPANVGRLSRRRILTDLPSVNTSSSITSAPAEAEATAAKTSVAAKVHVCICDRKPTEIVCEDCGHCFRGRAQRPCHIHPKFFFLMDKKNCRQCVSENITEIW